MATTLLAICSYIGMMARFLRNRAYGIDNLDGFVLSRVHHHPSMAENSVCQTNLILLCVSAASTPGASYSAPGGGHAD